MRVWFPIVCFCVVIQLHALDLSSINTNHLENLFRAAETKEGPVTVVAFGDSLQIPWRSVGRHLFATLESKIGFSGIALAGQSPNLAVKQLLGDTRRIGPDELWWMDSWELPPGSAMFWTNQAHHTGSLVADSLGVHFIASPQAGEFTVSISTNGGPWVPLATVNAFSVEPEGRLAEYSVPLNLYRLRVESNNGTNRILGPMLVNSTSTGIVPVYLWKDGINLNQILGTPPEVLEPVIANLQPDLIIWHMKELGDIGSTALETRLDELEALWRRTAPQADVVYIGTPYEAKDTNSVYVPYTEKQNSIVRSAALRHDRAYVDCMTPFESYEAMLDQGYMDDKVHPGNTCYEVMADLVWRELGLFALGLDRKLRFDSAASNLSWATVPGVHYTIEASEDFQEWMPIHESEGNGSPQKQGVPAKSPARFFRLKLEQQ